jgi:hypothetical protein
LVWRARIRAGAIDARVREIDPLEELEAVAPALDEPLLRGAVVVHQVPWLLEQGKRAVRKAGSSAQRTFRRLRMLPELALLLYASASCCQASGESGDRSVTRSRAWMMRSMPPPSSRSALA